MTFEIGDRVKVVAYLTEDGELLKTDKEIYAHKDIIDKNIVQTQFIGVEGHVIDIDADQNELGFEVDGDTLDSMWVNFKEVELI
jgi:hypothetical protein